MAQAAEENQVSQNLRERFELAAANSQPLVTSKRQSLKRSASELYSEGDILQHQEPAPKRSRIGAFFGMVFDVGRSFLRMATKLSMVRTSYTKVASTAATGHTSAYLEEPNTAECAPLSMNVTAQRRVCFGPQGDIGAASRTCRSQIRQMPLGPATSLGPSVTKQGNQLSHDRQPSQRSQQAGKANQASQAYSSKSVMADPHSKPELVTGRVATLQGQSFESLLHVQPEEKITFPSVVVGTSATRTLSLKNVSKHAMDYVAFKIKTTSPQSLLAHPGHGVIGPSQQKDICLTLRNEKAGGSGNPRYMIQVASVSDGNPLSLDAWKKLSKNEVLERQLGVAIADPGTLILPEPAAGELCFSETGEAGALGSTLMLTNLSGTHVAFKMKANNHCDMTPSRGTLGPDQQVKINCRLEDKSHWERVPAFLMQAVAVGTAAPLDNKEWPSFRRESIQECRWTAVMKRLKANAYFACSAKSLVKNKEEPEEPVKPKHVPGGRIPPKSGGPPSPQSSMPAALKMIPHLGVGGEKDEKGDSQPSNVLFVENLSAEVNETMLTILFRQYPGFQEARLIKGRNVAFIAYADDLRAGIAKDGLQGLMVTPEMALKISFAKQ